jgi:hypothetical protein
MGRREPGGVCDRCGGYYPRKSLRREWTEFLVCWGCFEEKHPQLTPVVPRDADPRPVENPRPFDSRHSVSARGGFSPFTIEGGYGRARGGAAVVPGGELLELLGGEPRAVPGVKGEAGDGLLGLEGGEPVVTGGAVGPAGDGVLVLHGGEPAVRIGGTAHAQGAALLLEGGTPRLVTIAVVAGAVLELGAGAPTARGGARARASGLELTLAGGMPVVGPI